MAGYGDEDEIKRQLSLDDGNPDDAGAIVRVAQINEELSRVFDIRCGRHGTADETRTVDASARIWSGDAWWPSWGWLDPITAAYRADLILPWPVLAVTGISVGGTWDGAAWDGETALDADAYRLAWGDASRGFYRVERLDGSGWSGPVRIAGTWLNAAFTDPPDEVIGALTFLVVQHFREDQMSPAGVVGPDGMQVPSRNPWGYERVKAVIERYRVFEVVV